MSVSSGAARSTDTSGVCQVRGDAALIQWCIMPSGGGCVGLVVEEHLANGALQFGDDLLGVSFFRDKSIGDPFMGGREGDEG